LVRCGLWLSSIDNGRTNTSGRRATRSFLERRSQLRVERGEVAGEHSPGVHGVRVVFVDDTGVPVPQEDVEFVYLNAVAPARSASGDG
jgi:hypothetical protein